LEGRRSERERWRGKRDGGVREIEGEVEMEGLESKRGIHRESVSGCVCEREKDRESV
jgi:hypothetical protein